MITLTRKVARWFKIDSEQGVTAIEYGLIAALVALAIIAGATLLGTNLNALFNNIAGQLAVGG
jgi:pilus assembly protein Flp/PilA